MKMSGTLKARVALGISVVFLLAIVCVAFVKLAAPPAEGTIPRAPILDGSCPYVSGLGFP